MVDSTRSSTPATQSDLDGLKVVLTAALLQNDHHLDTVKRHALFGVWCDLVLALIIVAVGLQSRYAWPVSVADATYLMAGMVLGTVGAAIYRGRNHGS